MELTAKWERGPGGEGADHRGRGGLRGRPERAQLARLLRLHLRDGAEASRWEVRCGEQTGLPAGDPEGLGAVETGLREGLKGRLSRTGGSGIRRLRCAGGAPRQLLRTPGPLTRPHGPRTTRSSREGPGPITRGDQHTCRSHSSLTRNALPLPLSSTSVLLGTIRPGCQVRGLSSALRERTQRKPILTGPTKVEEHNCSLIQ